MFGKILLMKTNYIFNGLISVFACFVIIAIISCKAHNNSYNSDNINVDTVTAQDYLKKGSRQLDLKNYEKALELFNKVIQMEPENGEGYSYRGMAKYNLKDYKGAIEDYDMAIKLIPDYGEVYDLRGIAKGESGDKIGACEDWNKAYMLGFDKAFKLIEKYCIEDEIKK